MQHYGKEKAGQDEPGSTGRVHTSLWIIGVATQWTLCSTQCCSQWLAEQCTARQTCGDPALWARDFPTYPF